MDTPVNFGLKQAAIINLLAVPPTIIVAGLAGFSIIILLLVAYAGLPVGLIQISLLCLWACFAMLFATPGLLFANYYVTALASEVAHPSKTDDIVCQITTQPRTTSGLPAFLEDADDIGFLNIRDGKIQFKGDHTELVIVLSEAEKLEILSIGARGAWLASRRIRIVLPEGEPIQKIDFAERQTWTIPQSWQLSYQVFDKMIGQLTSA